jgi:2-polyprenyl-3-methyl-5-hydroxy-6-metoxy-1,4-benzoquinol methylase
MIEKQDVIDFFNRHASSWDQNNVRNDAVIAEILDNACIRPCIRVLDVACGTGVLIPDYLRRNVSSITAVDLSPEMINIAKRKFPQDNIRWICGDVETSDTGADYDAIVIYNALPHFQDPERLISLLASRLAPGGILTVAHGASRETIDAHHKGPAHKVSVGLMPAADLAAIFAKYLTVTVSLSTDRMYQVAGIRP